jgi:ornithine cyclodeaminase/alanine dehydrogenase-like protein (mu-crystallin family)
MKWVAADEVARLAPYGELVEALREGFKADIQTPVRHHHETTPSTTLLLMPAWGKDYTGLKTTTVKTDNAAQGLPTVQAAYLLISNQTGAPVCMMDGTELTRRRTAAASALAADYLARKDSSTLLLVGAGALGRHFALAHAAVRPLQTVLIFNRSPEKSHRLAAELNADGFMVEMVSDVEAATRRADIVSCVTSATSAIIKGTWLKPGTHVDLAGAFKPTMREVDGDTVAKARVYVDTHEGALAEAGDLLQAQAEGKFDFKLVQGDLAGLCKGKVHGRKTDAEITLFKSVGTALEDLVAATFIHLRS